MRHVLVQGQDIDTVGCEMLQRLLSCPALDAKIHHVGLDAIKVDDATWMVVKASAMRRARA